MRTAHKPKGHNMFDVVVSLVSAGPSADAQLNSALGQLWSEG